MTAVDPERPTLLSVAVRRGRHEVVVAVCGELDLSSAPVLEREMALLWRSGFGSYVLDLGAVTFLDSSGLRLLLDLRNAAKRRHHKLVLIAGPPHVQRVFDITATRWLFEWQDDHHHPAAWRFRQSARLRR